METIDLEPRYSSCDMTGRCIKCLAEEQLKECIIDLLGDVEDGTLQARYKALVAFLEAPETKQLIDETELMLSEGKKVRLKLTYENDRLNFETIVEDDPQDQKLVSPEKGI